MAASLDGEWSHRWNGGTSGKEWTTGTATVKAGGDRVYIHLKDPNGAQFLIDARREWRRRLVGRYQNLGDPNDARPWVGRVVDDERIDGQWGEGRWDLRRKLADD